MLPGLANNAIPLKDITYMVKWSPNLQCSHNMHTLEEFHINKNVTLHQQTQNGHVIWKMAF